MRVDGNNGATKGYSPNSIGEWKTQPGASYPASPTEGISMRYNPYENRTDDCFYQPGNLYRLMTEDKRELLIQNTVADMKPVTDNIKFRHAAHCYLADKEYGTRLAKAMYLDMRWVEHLASLSEEERLRITAS
jgi:catalase